jgi:AraC family transcriptional regulator
MRRCSAPSLRAKLLYDLAADDFLAKIAIELEEALDRRAKDDSEGTATSRLLAEGDGWRVADVLCTSGPRDRPFEEQHGRVAIAIVAAGTFQYRSSAGHALMTPGSLLLGNHGQAFQCGHEHGSGDRCLSFQYSEAAFERIAAGAGGRMTTAFATPRLPPLRGTSAIIARSLGALLAAGDSVASGGIGDETWEELSVELAGTALQLANDVVAARPVPRGATARVSRAIRHIERNPGDSHSLGELAERAGLTPWHFLRTFEQLTGVTPHQFLIRTRLREAAARLLDDRAKIVDIALDSGFNDVSNFNRMFHAELGASPRRYRQRYSR